MSRPFSSVYVVRSFLGIALACTAPVLAVACGGTPDPTHDVGRVDADPTAALAAPSSCHVAVGADGDVGVSCDTLSPGATSYALQRLDDEGSWSPVLGSTSQTPDLTDKVDPTSTEPLSYRVCAESDESDESDDATACSVTVVGEMPSEWGTAGPPAPRGSDWLSRTPAKE